MTLIKDLETLNDWMSSQTPCKDIQDLRKLLDDLWENVDTSNSAMLDKFDHVKRVEQLSIKQSNDNDLIVTAALAHDIGRILQFILLGKFDDRAVLHHHLGTQIFEQLMFKGIVPNDEAFIVIRTTIAYHGRKKFLPSLLNTPEIVSVLDVISSIDDIDNGCIGAIGYLDRESDDDVKGYGRENQTIVSNEVFDFFQNGEKFDKMKFCHTYSEYILFVAVLAIQSLKNNEYSHLAGNSLELSCRDSYSTEYATALEAYKAIFERRLENDMAKKCYQILLDYYVQAKIDGYNTAEEVCLAIFKENQRPRITKKCFSILKDFYLSYMK